MNAPHRHPAEYLGADLVRALRDAAPAAERAGCLHPAQLALVHREGWLRSALPAALGGRDLDLPALLTLEEALAWADGSTGWVVTLCAGAAWFAGFLDPALTARVLAADAACIAGSGAVDGVAETVAGGYRVRGRWRYASGITHATAATCNCRVLAHGVPLTDAAGRPLVRAFLLERGEYRVERDWHAMGLVATGSHAFAVDGVTVPSTRAFDIDPATAARTEPVFRVPFDAFAALTLAANLAGLATRYLDLCPALLPVGEASATALTAARRDLDSARDQLHGAGAVLWRGCLAGSTPTPHAVNVAIAASHSLAAAARTALNDLQPLLGLRAVDTRTEINRAWRDFHTASQHALFRAQPGAGAMTR
jgi:indole-3-acetate monooxygenase